MCTYHGKQPPYAKTSFGYDTINLVRNPNATDPTWQQLQAFLVADSTDKEVYNLLTFPCGAFAEELCNHAEASGIRAAWVAIDFADGSEGHALNAFLTTDKGLVYIDCTGDNIQRYTIGGNNPAPTNNDKVAYVQVGKELGFISLNSNAPLTYQGYENEKNKIDDYNSDVESYNQYIAGKVFIIGSAEDNYAEAWYQRLNQEKAALQDVRQPDGIVSSVEVYW